ncbi:hypothetical protein TCAL_14923 [Tigriopus californicus]|uniref:Uncharacterized protein n=1 Tax=Tigriopus californicus TaxID=6832 RepID=A0A553N6F6_TIGCA|nr:hypothetical protein TCAL_14923 [Tigriopus californicus]
MPNQFHGTLICRLVIVAALFGWIEGIKYASYCKKNSQCQPLHKLAQCDPTEKQCLCPNDHVWLNDLCQSKLEVEKERAKAEEATYVARLITILIPVIGAVIFLSCVAFMFCYWLKLIDNTEEKVLKDNTVTEKYDTKPVEDESVEDSEDEEDSFETDEDDYDEEGGGETYKMTSINVPPKRSISVLVTTENETTFSKDTHNEVPQLKINGIQEKNYSRAISCPDQGSSSGDISSLKQSETVKQTVFTVDRDAPSVEDNGYQASMKQFLAKAHSPFSEPATRPMSARYISNTRPGTAVRAHSALLTPRGGGLSGRNSVSTGRISPSIVGPYLSDPSKFRSRPTSPRPLELKTENLTELYDKIAAVAVKEEKQQEVETKQKKSSLEFQGKEEGMKIVRVAANKFKQRQNLKKLSKGKKKGKGKKFESLVDQVVRMRLEEERVPKPRLAKGKNSVRRGSSGTDSIGSSSGSSKPSYTPDGSRPESVALRVLKERQAQKIKAKTPVTSKKKPRPSVERKMKQKMEREKASPLYMALKQSASLHTSKEQLKERIKQQVHLNAVLNYQTPPIEVVFNHSKEQQRPAKSILKKHDSRNGRANLNAKSSTGSSVIQRNGTESQVGNVNPAFEGISDEENRNPMSPSERSVKKVTHSAEVYFVHQ